MPKFDVTLIVTVEAEDENTATTEVRSLKDTIPRELLPLPAIVIWGGTRPSVYAPDAVPDEDGLAGTHDDLPPSGSTSGP